MKLDDVKAGLPVTTVSELRNEQEMSVIAEQFSLVERFLKARRPNLEGKLNGYAPGSGQQYWSVIHRTGDRAVYHLDELMVK